MQGFLFEIPQPQTRSLRTRPAAYHASPSPRERAVRYLFFQTLLGYEHHPRAVNLLIYSRRFLEFCQPRPQSALVLFTLLVVCSRLSRIFVPIRPPFLSFRFVFLSLAPFRGSPLARPVCLFDNVIAVSFFFFSSSKNPLSRFLLFHRSIRRAILPSESNETNEERRSVSLGPSVDWPAPRIYKIRHDRAIHSILPREIIYSDRTRPIVV